MAAHVNSQLLINNFWEADGYHLTRPLNDGKGAYRSMLTAIKSAGIKLLLFLNKSALIKEFQ